jgi:hypothetical protein
MGSIGKVWYSISGNRENAAGSSGGNDSSLHSWLLALYPELFDVDRTPDVYTLSQWETHAKVAGVAGSFALGPLYSAYQAD